VLDDAERVSPPDADPWQLRVPGVRLQRRLAPAQRHGDWRRGVDTFLGVAESDGRDVTVRVYRRAVRDERRRRRFADEVELLQGLATMPHVAQLRDGGFTDGGRAYLCTEYCPDGSLEDRLALLGRFTSREVAGLGAKLADGWTSCTRWAYCTATCARPTY